MEIIHTIDGVNINTYGVYVSESKGLFSRPKLKAPESYSWPEYHGKVVDLAHRYYEARKITLNCFLKATSNEDFINKVSTFLAAMDQAGTRRLMVQVDEAKPLVYEVFIPEDIDIKKKWSPSSMVGVFDIVFEEPYPVKRVLKHIRASVATKTVSVTISTPKLVSIYWGDGAVTHDISGTNQTVTHDYASDGTYYPVITGNIDEISALTTNATVVWTKL